MSKISVNAHTVSRESISELLSVREKLCISMAIPLGYERRYGMRDNQAFRELLAQLRQDLQHRGMSIVEIESWVSFFRALFLRLDQRLDGGSILVFASDLVSQVYYLDRNTKPTLACDSTFCGVNSLCNELDDARALTISERV